MSRVEKLCMHCGDSLGEFSRAVECFVPGGSKFRLGRACKPCWEKRLPGSLLYRAALCKKDVCDCGWCSEWLAIKAQRESKKEATNA